MLWWVSTARQGEIIWPYPEKIEPPRTPRTLGTLGTPSTPSELTLLPCLAPLASLASLAIRSPLPGFQMTRPCAPPSGITTGFCIFASAPVSIAFARCSRSRLPRSSPFFSLALGCPERFLYRKNGGLSFKDFERNSFSQRESKCH